MANKAQQQSQKSQQAAKSAKAIAQSKASKAAAKSSGQDGGPYKPTKSSAIAQAKTTKPTTTGYFNPKGQPTFVNSPGVKSLAQTPSGLPPAKQQALTDSGAIQGTKTPAAQPAPVAPFLTPAQQLDQINFDAGIDGQIQTLGDAIRDAGINTAQGLIDAQKSHDVNTASANETAAARGLFQSSIRSSDLNDIDATLATRQNTLNTALSNLTISNDASIGRLQTQRTTGDNTFLGQAVANAQAQTPVLPPASNSTHTTPNPASPPPIPTPEQQTTTHPILPPNAQQPNITDPFAVKPPSNPFWSQATGKSWNPAKPPGSGSSGGFSSTVTAVKPPGWTNK